MMRPSQDAPGFYVDTELKAGQLVCGTCFAIIPGYTASRQHGEWHATLVTADGDRG